MRKILEEYHLYLLGKYNKIHTIRANFNPVKHFLSYQDKPLEQITNEDMTSWKAYINQSFILEGEKKQYSAMNTRLFLNSLLKGFNSCPFRLPQNTIKQYYHGKEVSQNQTIQTMGHQRITPQMTHGGIKKLFEQHHITTNKYNTYMPVVVTV